MQNEEILNALLAQGVFDTDEAWEKGSGIIPDRTIGGLLLEKKNRLLGVRPRAFSRTGFTTFDTAFSGFLKGGLTILAGVPNVGKTQLFIDIAWNLIYTNSVLFFSMDLNEKEILQRFLSSKSQVPIKRIVEQEFTSEDYEAIEGVYYDLNMSQPIELDSKVYRSALALRDAIKRRVSNYTSIVFIDSLSTLVEECSSEESYDETLRFVCQVLKKTAKELDVAIVTSFEIDEKEEKVTPMIKDFHPVLTSLADQIICLHRSGDSEQVEKENTKEIAELLMLQGELGSVRIEYDNSIPKFY